MYHLFYVLLTPAVQRKACHNNSFINLVFIHVIQILPDMTNVLDIYKIVRNWLLASKINF